MKIFARSLIAIAAILTVFAPVSATQPPAGAAAPRLVVVVVVDQFRSDYFDEYGMNFSGGFQRLMKEGAWFKNAAYPYLNTVTCSGHATIGTGTFPWHHGVILNEWVDRSAGRIIACTEDSGTKEVGYGGGAPTKGESAKLLLVDTLAEQMRDRTKARVVSMSLKPRSAIMMAGPKADAVIWLNDRGGWATSAAYTREPVPVLKQFIDKNPIAADFGKVWERAREASTYKYDDDAVGEAPPSGWTRTFPHLIGPVAGQQETRLVSYWQRTPFADEYLERMAIAAIEGWQLGRGEGTDFLAVSFSTLDSIGHGFGPRSHEVQDTLARLDATLGRFLSTLDERLGRGNYVLAFSSDHGVAPIPEQVGPTAGRQLGKQTADALDRALSGVLGTGPHVAVAAYTDIYLMPGVFDRLKQDPRAMMVAINTLRGLPGVLQVFRADELKGKDARTSTDPMRRAAALSYHADRSGDFVIVPRENWLFASSATTHGTLHPYDQRVPVILFGAGVTPGVYTQDATPADIAPSLAAIARVRTNSMDGRVLQEALKLH